MTSLEEDVPRSQLICMLAIPAWLTCHDLLHFLAPCCPGIRRVRIIRDATPNQYMALVLFRTQVQLKNFIATTVSLIRSFCHFRKRLMNSTKISMAPLTTRWNQSSVIWCMSLKWRFAVTVLIAEVWTFPWRAIRNCPLAPFALSGWMSLWTESWRFYAITHFTDLVWRNGATQRE